MMRHLLLILFLWAHCSVILNAQLVADPPIYPGQDRSYPFHDAAGSADTTAVYKEDASIVAWASGYTNLQYGEGVAEMWRTPARALGAAQGISTDIVSLGRAGHITLTFANPITNGAGFDFAVFENSFSSTFLELAWVEVSSDGEHFVRFPCFSYTQSPVGAFGNVDPTNIHGLAGKYQAGYGTPFDLSELQLAYDAASQNTDSDFTDVYKASLLENFPFLDLNAIRYVQLIDVVGDGSARDVDGTVVDGTTGIPGGVIYDPYPTFSSVGFDLDAVAVIHQLDATGSEQVITFDEVGNRRIEDGLFQLSSNATSDLPVSYILMEGFAVINGSTLTPTGLGQVVVQAIQEGDAIYAPAVPVTRSFYVADELQHIFIWPPSNQLVSAMNVPFNVVSSSGLPVSLFVFDGPMNATVSEFGHLFNSGALTGSVTIRASLAGGQSGGVLYAPATDVLVRFEIVAAGSDEAPQSFTAWQAVHSILAAPDYDTDGDGFRDLEEYAAGTDPQSGSDRPLYTFDQEANGDHYILELSLDSRALVDWAVQSTVDLSDADAWASIIPEILPVSELGDGAPSNQTLRLRVPAETGAQQFWRFEIDAR